MNRSEPLALPMFYLKLFGSPTLSRDGVSFEGRATQRHRVALLALLATSGPGGLSRERLMAMLWPETGPERARNLLKVSVYELRRALGTDALLSHGEDLRLNPERVESDVDAFERALESGDYERAAELHSGPFLDGFFLKRAPTFERWVDDERGRLAGAHLGALEALAEAAERCGELHEASKWWEAATTGSPYDSRLALRLMRVLEAMGNPGGALRHGEAHERSLRSDLGISPSQDVTSFVERLHGRALADEESPTKAPRAGPPFRLQTFGMLELHGPDGSVTVASPGAEPGLTVLAVLAGSGTRGVARETLLLYFWPDLPWREANEALDGLLRTIGGWTQESGVVGDDPIELDGSVIASDVSELEQAARRGSLDDVLALTRGTFLEGALRERSPELTAWIGAQRSRLGVMRGEAAERASRSADKGAPTPPAAAAGSAWRSVRPKLIGYAAAAFSAVAVVAYAIVSASAAPPVRPLIPRETTTNSAARDLFDAANIPARFRNDSLARVSLDFFRRAVAVDPSFAGAHAELAVMYLRIAPAENPVPSRAERTARALWHARKAVELADSLGRAHAALGGALLSDYDFQGAEKARTRALGLDPNNGYTHQLLVHLRIFQRRFDAALTQALRGRQSDPASSDVVGELARAHRVNGRCDEARRWLDSLSSVEPPLLAARGLRAQCLVQERRWEEAIDVQRQQGPAAGSLGLGVLGSILARAARGGAVEGRDPSTLALWETEARAILETLLARAALGSATSVDVANVYVGLGELDLAFDWLERAVEDRSLRFFIMEPQYRELHEHPRFQTLLERLGLPRR